MAKRISATEAARSFSEVVTRVRFKGEEFIVEKGGEPVCKISPVGPATRSTASEFAHMLRGLVPPDPGYFDVLREIIARQDQTPLEDPWAR